MYSIFDNMDTDDSKNYPPMGYLLPEDDPHSHGSRNFQYCVFHAGILATIRTSDSFDNHYFVHGASTFFTFHPLALLES